MAELSYWWTTSATPTGDQQPSYSQAHLATISKVLGAAMGAEGVVPDPMGIFGGELALSSPASNTTRVSPGAAIVDGHPYVNDANLDLVHDATPSSRTDAIVLRADWANFNVSIVLLKGADGGTPPVLATSRGSTFDILLGYADLDSGGNINYVYSTRQWATPKVDNVTLERKTNSFELRVKAGGIGATQIADGAVVTSKIPNNAVTTDKIPNLAITTSKLAEESVTWPKIAERTIVTDRIAAGAVNVAEIADGAVVTSKIPNNAVTTAKLADSAVVTAKIGTGAVTEAKLANEAVTWPKIAERTIVSDRIAAGAVNVAELADGAVVTAKIGNDAVDDTKVGNRVPQFIRRKGGHPSQWDQPGNTVYTPGMVRMQGGVHNAGNVGNGASVHGDVTFPVAFGAAPMVVATAYTDGDTTPLDQPATITLSDIDANGFSFRILNHGSQAITLAISWLAVGPE